MKRILLLFMIICTCTKLSSAQDVAVWKHILRFGNDRYMPLGYIASKYRYHDTTLLYEMDFSYNGWQVYDSVAYNNNNGVWYISTFCPDSNFQFYLRSSDTTENLFNKNVDIHYNTDKYNILSRYLNDINFLISTYNTDSNLLSWNNLGDTSCYYFIDADYTLLFAHYGIPMKDYLEKYCCHIGKHGEYDWDIFSFLEYTIVRSFDYDIHGNINKVTITRTHAKSNEKTIWIETFPIQDFSTHNSE